MDHSLSSGDMFALFDIVKYKQYKYKYINNIHVYICWSTTHTNPFVPYILLFVPFPLICKEHLSNIV